MQKQIQLLGLTLSALLAPGILFAQSAPSPVTGIAAAVQGNQITVSWNAPAETDISYYRVYLSSKSILENGGSYDDFEATPDANTFYTLQHRPTSGSVYIAVLAVNRAGMEGDVFVEEAIVVAGTPNNAPTFTPTLKTLPPPVTQQPPPPEQISPPESEQTAVSTFDVTTENPVSQEEAAALRERIQQQVESLPTWEGVSYGGKLHLILTDVISPTEVVLTFSGNPTVDVQSAPDAFSIVDSEGGSLRIESILIEGDTITVQTEKQTRGVLYEIKLKEPLQGTDGSPLDATNRQGFFTGHPTGAEAVQPAEETAPVPEEPADPRSISNLRLTTSSLLNGVYTVHARWEVRNAYNDLIYYAVRQSNDGGATFSDPTIMPFTINGLDVPGVLQGQYGLGITTISMFGYQSPEVFASIAVGPQEVPKPPKVVELPAETEPSEVLGVETVIEEEEEVETVPAVNSGNLSQSGAGIALGMVGTIGVCAGFCRKRKQR
ncbi:hypothetical protein COU78_06350 [Candidatus Peregrinibacteria bacterium CG10_big_fil_rev_8_21_14_0_10_49_24]|nr:MAG: hypothetical protein COV83_03180 [Candidatus Peregrinibacteria bacterium CG11_big_fil_rev_8_21_14_0_20_49_14]PIR50471.1 MAG: hypothetical protein COU78_06350 [Candidatus Peregrinibacteria bacterium CG10_big_fil_rev_8_21_14_0_10_49_24]PJA68307.1 MAG: hypothetical protein CO157_00340 [Candidatus Peregrinibacteria bacterium CG_4_9_14_3_um_filter_49_12]